MKTLNFALLWAVLAAGLAVAPAADARGHGHYYRHHHGARVGVFVGAPLFPNYYSPNYYSPYYYPPYPYYYPPAVAAPAAPPVYIEQGPTAPDTSAPSVQAPQTAPSAQGPTAYWYYCPDSKTYYPYVQQCASPWQQVQPQPQASANPQ